jgi:PAS domain S-box-containing protein
MGDEHADQPARGDGPRASTNASEGAAVYYVDSDGELGWWTDTLRSLTGYDQNELSGMRAADLVKTDGGRTLTDLLETERTDRSWIGELELARSDGTTVPCRHEACVVTDGNGDPVGLVAVVTGPSDRDGTDAPLGTYRRIIETLGAVVGELGSAGTQAGIERTVCEGLVDSTLYTAAWIGHRDRDGSLTPTVSVGPGTEGEATPGALDGADEFPPADETLETGETRVVRCDAPELPEAFRSFAAANGIASAVSVPVASGPTTDRVLVACSDRPEGFDDIETWAFEQLGRIVGFAVNAAHTERIVLSEPVVELEFRITSTELPLVRLAREEGGTGRMKWMSRETDGTVVQYFTIDGIDAGTVVESVTAAEQVLSCTPIGAGAADLYEIRLSESLAVELLDAGVETRDIRIEDGGATIVTTVPRSTNVRNVIQQVRSVYPDVELAAKRTLDEPGEPRDGTRANDVSLTDRQLDALVGAFEEGYFEWPREATAEEVAERLDISAATLHYHLRRAERALVDAFLDAERREPNGESGYR